MVLLYDVRGLAGAVVPDGSRSVERVLYGLTSPHAFCYSNVALPRLTAVEKEAKGTTEKKRNESYVRDGRCLLMMMMMMHVRITKEGMGCSHYGSL